MKEIKIKFSPEMTRAIIEGRKCTTARKEETGEHGDVFLLGDRFFRIIYIKPVCLWAIKELYFRTEGFTSPEEFESSWRSINRGNFSDEQVYFLHFFAYAGPLDFECTECPFGIWDKNHEKLTCVHPEQKGADVESDITCPLWEKGE